MRIKRILALLLSVVMLLGTTAMPAFAENEKERTYTRTAPQKIASHLYEVEYDDWNPEKAEAIGHCLAKPDLMAQACKVKLSVKERRTVIDVLEKYFGISGSNAQSLICYITDNHTPEEYINFILQFIENYITDPSARHILEQLYCDETTGANDITPTEFVSFLINLNGLGKYYAENPLKTWNDLLDDIEALSPYACTSCRTGDIIGRNFDWVYDDVDEYIIRVPKAIGRHASVGVASGFFPPEIQAFIGIEDILPMLTMDGINDSGVAINVNVVASGDVPALLSEDDSRFEEYLRLSYTSGTNAGHDPFDNCKDVCAGFVVREILNNADSAADAIEILTRDKNVYSIITQEFHWMISDKKETYIAECVNNQLVVLKTKEDKQAAMSNFHVTNSEYMNDYNVVYPKKAIKNGLVSDQYTVLPLGIERYEIVKKGLSGVVNEETMLANMREVWYKEKLYSKGNTKFWSDMNMHGWKDSSGKSHIFTHGDDKIDPEAKAAREKDFEDYINVKLPAALKREEEDPEHRRQRMGDDPNGVIQTVHTSVYNLRQKTLTVNVQERKTSFSFALGDAVNANSTPVFVNEDNVGRGVKCEEAGKEWEYNRDTKELTLKNCNENAYQLIGEDSKVTVIRAKHQWDSDFTIDAEPTADKAGSKSVHCLVCGARKDITEIPAVGKMFNTKTGIAYNDRDQWNSVFLLVIAAITLSGVVIYRLKKKN